MAGCACEAGEYRVRRVCEVDAHGIREHEAQHEVLQRSALQLGTLEPRLLAQARTGSHVAVGVEEGAPLRAARAGTRVLLL